MNKAVAYYRVSTKKQGESGLGLAAQQDAVLRFAATNGFTIISPDGEFTEIETGTRKRYRPKLAEALQMCQERDATLLVAKLDRLARNVHFVTGLMESGVDFVAVDMPKVNNLTIHILAAVAEDEAQRISGRIKDALRQKVERDGEWRESYLTDAHRRKGAETRRQMAIDHYRTLTYTAQLMRQSGMSYQAIADKLNELGNRTVQGKRFERPTVYRMLKRA